MKIFKIPRFVKLILARRKWDFSVDHNSFHLTFDDGPHPETTPWLLAWLKEHKLKATFFCVGENARLYPELMQQIVEEGHLVGNHTMYHEKGLKCSTNDYIASVEQASEYIPSKLFRPPYGKMKWSQARALRKQGYEIVMWTWLAYDFDLSVPVENFKVLSTKFKAGDIVVLHDNIRYFERTKAMLQQL
ncbi:MAG: polysaccharide deacetylase family protein [Bacteroidota bacterium]